MTGIAIGYSGSWGTAVADAGTHQVTLQYSCSVPGMGAQSASTVISWDFPDTVTVGQSTPPVPFTSTVQVPSSEVETAHTYFGVASFNGSGESSITITAPQGDIPVTVSATFPSTSVPASGPLTIVIPSTFPPITPTRPGVAQVIAGTITEHVTPRDADGNPTFIGTETVTCTPEAGQSALIQSVRINPAPQSTRPSAHTSAAGAAGSHRHLSGPLSPSSSSAGSGRIAHPPSSATTATAIPAAHAPIRISGKDIVIIVAAAVGIMGIAGLAAWLAAYLRKIRQRRRL